VVAIIVEAIRSDDLTRDQARALKNMLQPMLGYLNKLQHRMQNKGFPLDDPLWLLVSCAQRSMQDLITDLRRRSTKPLPKRYNQPQYDGNQRRGD
jgi:hypothetical protein